MTIVEHECEIEIPFFDLDPMNIVWHGNYIKYLEIARCELLKEIDYRYSDMRNDKIMYPIAKLDVKYIKPCTFNQKIKILTSIEELEPCLIIKYLIKDAITGEKLLKASTMQICVSMTDGTTIYEIPKNFAQKIESYLAKNKLKDKIYS